MIQQLWTERRLQWSNLLILSEMLRFSEEMIISLVPVQGMEFPHFPTAKRRMHYPPSLPANFSNFKCSVSLDKMLCLQPMCGGNLKWPESSPRGNNGSTLIHLYYNDCTFIDSTITSLKLIQNQIGLASACHADLGCPAAFIARISAPLEEMSASNLQSSCYQVKVTTALHWKGRELRRTLSACHSRSWTGYGTNHNRG